MRDSRRFADFRQLNIPPVLGTTPDPLRPAANQPGTLLQELAGLFPYFNDPLRHLDPAAAVRRARAAVIPHATTLVVVTT